MSKPKTQTQTSRADGGGRAAENVVSVLHPRLQTQYVVGWLFNNREEGHEAVRSLALRAALAAKGGTSPKGVDGQVWLAAQQMDDVQREQPEWLWYEHVDETRSFGRWKKDQRQAPYIRADLLLAAPPPPPVEAAGGGSGDLAALSAGAPTPAAIEAMAEHLLEEGYRNYAWPTHERDEGYRGGGYVTIAPPDIQAELREKATRILIRAAQIAADPRSSPTPELPIEPARFSQQATASNDANLPDVEGIPFGDPPKGGLFDGRLEMPSSPIPGDAGDLTREIERLEHELDVAKQERDAAFNAHTHWSGEASRARDALAEVRAELADLRSVCVADAMDFDRLELAASDVVQRLSELENRGPPADRPEMLLVTRGELVCELIAFIQSQSAHVSPVPGDAGDLAGRGEDTREIAVSRDSQRCPMCGSSWSYDGEREDDPLFCEICDSDPDVEDQRTSDLEAQGEPLGDQPTHPTDPFLKVVVTIKRDDTTTCSLSFGRAAKFPLARAAVLKAIQALQAEIADSDKCPASIASTPDLGAQGEPVAWAYEELRTRTFDEWEPALSYDRPRSASWFRNIEPLFKQSPAAPRSGSGVTVEQIANEAAFLLDRLREFENEHLTDETARDYYGHVMPSIERLTVFLQAPRPGETGAQTKAARDVLGDPRVGVHIGPDGATTTAPAQAHDARSEGGGDAP